MKYGKSYLNDENLCVGEVVFRVGGGTFCGTARFDEKMGWRNWMEVLADKEFGEFDIFVAVGEEFEGPAAGPPPGLILMNDPSHQIISYEGYRG